METISSIANTASKAIWGEQTPTQQNETGGIEPISGEKGKGTPNEPYDQGNTTQRNETGGIEPISGVEGKGTPNEPYDQGNSEDSTTTKNTNTLTTESDITPHIKETSSSSTGQTPSDNKDTTAVSKESNTKPADNVQPPMIMSSNTPTNLTSAATGGDIDPHKTTENTGVHSHTGNAPKADILAPTDRSGNPGAAPASGAAPFAKQQGADKPSQAPLEEAKDAINIKTDDAERLLKSHDPNDHSGEPMKMHDGNEIKVPLTQEERRTSTAGNPGGQEHGKEPKGTGEQYIKSTGVAADGGDFDATKPGAGREADRLREEKGIKKATTSGDVDKTTSAGSHASGDKEKTKLSDMIKDKLHIGHKNK